MSESIVLNIDLLSMSVDVEAAGQTRKRFVAIVSSLALQLSLVLGTNESNYTHDRHLSCSKAWNELCNRALIPVRWVENGPGLGL